MNGKIIGFNVDPSFNHCLDGLVLVNISDILIDIFDNLAKELEEGDLKKRFEYSNTFL